jgi:hypothetical protein
MQVERHQLMDILRSRGDEKTAQRAEQSLPQIVDLARDHALLRLCGIDPNVLAAFLSEEDHLAQPTPQPLTGEDHTISEDPSRGAPPATSTARAWRATDGPDDDTIYPLVPQLSQVSDSQVNREAPSKAVGPDEDLLRTSSPPVNRCPRCESTFRSIDRMLDHLHAHLKNPSLAGRGVAPLRSGLVMSTRELDDALEGLERALREPDPPLRNPDPPQHEGPGPHRQRFSLMIALGSLLLVSGVVLIAAGNAPIGIAIIVVVLILSAVERMKRRRRSSRLRSRPDHA